MKILYFLFLIFQLIQGSLFHHHLSAKPKYIQNWDTIDLSWSMFLEQRPDDWIGIYSPPESKDSEYISSKTINKTKSINLQLYNLRTPYQFRYFRGDCDKTPSKFNCSSIGISNDVYFLDDSYFQQIHLSLTQNESSRLITMISPVETNTWIEYSTESNKYNNKMVVNTYDRSDMCSAPANETFPYWYPTTHPGVGYIYSTKLTNLEYNKEYSYRFYDYYNRSPMYNFFIQPKQESTQLIIYADQDVFHPFCKDCKLNSKTTSPGTGSMETIQSVDRYVQNNDVDYLVHVGDLSYARGTALVWDLWSMMIQNTSSKIPYMVSIGNHEYDYYGDNKNDLSNPEEENGFHPDWGNYGHDSYGECGVPVNHRFPIDSNGNGIYWYSINYNNVHNIILSSEHNYTKGSKMYIWLENDLKTIDRKTTPWVLLFTHRPIYMSEVNQISQIVVTQRIRESLEELLYKYKVDIIFQGHMHLYERTGNVYEYRNVSDAPIYITLGAGGIALDNCVWSGVDWSLSRECKYYGYGILDIYNSTNLNWKFINSFDESIIDEFNLEKTK